MSNEKYVKYCPLCGGENPRRQAFCQHCHAGDLTTVPEEINRSRVIAKNSEVALTPLDSEQVIQNWHQEVVAECSIELLEDSSIKFKICDGQTVGRTAEADVQLAAVPRAEWISSVHARFFRRGSQWYIQHLGDTNYIKIAEDIYRGHEEVPVQSGQIITLSMTAFRFISAGEA